MSSSSIIIIIDDIESRLANIKAMDLANMRADKLEAMKAELVDAQDLITGAEAIGQ